MNTTWSRSNVHVVGSRRRADAIASLLSDIDATVDRDESALDALANLAGSSVATILVTPLPLLEVETAVSMLRVPASRTKTPILVVVSGHVSDADARQLYERGAYGVYEWPRDGLLIARAVSTLVAGAAEEHCPLDPDTFDRALRRRLDWVHGLTAEVSVDARDGEPELRGRVRSGSEKRRLVDFVAAMPGVESVDASGLCVDTKSSRDAEQGGLLARARAILEGLSARLEGSVAVSVNDDGAAILVGTLFSDAEFELIADSLLQLPGVESVFDATRKGSVDA